MSRKVPNQAPDRDVFLEDRRVKATAARCAADLTENQVWLLVETAARQNGRPADYCLTLLGFEPTDDDRAHIDWVASLHPEWQPWIDMAKRREPLPVPPRSFS